VAGRQGEIRERRDEALGDRLPRIGDFGCPTTCLKLAVVKTGPFKGAISDNPDYEIQAYGGTNLGIFEPEENVHICSVMEDLGFCGIQVGNVLGFAAELYQRGILTWASS